MGERTMWILKNIKKKKCAGTYINSSTTAAANDDDYYNNVECRNCIKAVNFYIFRVNILRDECVALRM